MKNSMVFYAAIAVGIIAIAVGAYLRFASTSHHTIGLIALIAGAVLLIAGIAAMVVMKPKTAK